MVVGLNAENEILHTLAFLAGVMIWSQVQISCVYSEGYDPFFYWLKNLVECLLCGFWYRYLYEAPLCPMCIWNYSFAIFCFNNVDEIILKISWRTCFRWIIRCQDPYFPFFVGWPDLKIVFMRFVSIERIVWHCLDMTIYHILWDIISFYNICAW